MIRRSLGLEGPWDQRKGKAGKIVAAGAVVSFERGGGMGGGCFAGTTPLITLVNGGGKGDFKQGFRRKRPRENSLDFQCSRLAKDRN